MVRELKDGVHSVGVQDAQRRLFDEIIQLPDGTSYNAYLIKGSGKTALIDTVDPPKQDQLLANLSELGVTKIDYVIANHAEQDHSGAIPAVLEKYPAAVVVTNEKCAEFLKSLLHIREDKFKIIKDGEELPLGGKTLKFVFAPWVHWPETILTYLVEDKILFSCDFFGSHYASDELYVKDEKIVYEAAKRYYAEIMMPFRPIIRGHLEKIRGMDVEVIATSHGPIYEKPKFILDAYGDWTSDEVKNEVVLPYVSMHGSTQKMVEYLTKALEERDITVKPFNLTGVDIGELAIALVDAATIVVASPTFLVGAHPSAVYATYLANALRPKTRLVSIIGSYGWGGQTLKQLSGLIDNLKVELVEPVLVKGQPKQQDYDKLDELAESILKKHKEYNIH